VIWRLRMMLMGRKRLLVIAGIVVLVGLLAAAGAVYALNRSDDKSASTQPVAAPVPTVANENLFYLQALAPTTRVSGCKMAITFTWKPHYRALRYVGETAVIRVSGAGLAGTYRRPFTKKGITFVTKPVSIAGGYRVWSAKVATLGGDAPGNETEIQAAPPTTTKCA
jgi:hypothetical protein